ncbi:AraC family transcriptional regulator, activator of mtrCDE [Pararobbsia alpina]|uniref:cupin domain-containing protein n=1 Tax=Pararobbsia alpina TaxID=621374 RepID=UPI0039A57B71
MPSLDWLSRLLVMMPVSGQLEIRCAYGAPWQVAYERSTPGEMPYHVVLSGKAVLETEDNRKKIHLGAGDIVLMAHGSAHVLHDGTGARPARARVSESLNFELSENSGKGERLDMLCGRFVLSPPHDRLMRDYFPNTLVVRTAAKRGSSSSASSTSSASSSSDVSASAASPTDTPYATDTTTQLTMLVDMMRRESMGAHLGAHAMLNAFSAALFALTLRKASESETAPMGLLAGAGHPRLAPALTAMFNDPAHPWTLPELAVLCHMSRATLVRQFQDHVGRSASDLLTDIRMTLAANELRNPSASTEAVAEKVGYQSLAAFRRAFAQRVGVTPGEWRRAGRDAA